MSRVNKTDSVLVLLKVKKPAHLEETRNKKGKTLGNVRKSQKDVSGSWMLMFTDSILLHFQFSV